MGFPYYESLGSEDGKFIHYEFFRLDSAHYYVQEYFKNGVVKNIGKEAIDKNVLDSVMVDVITANNPPGAPFYLSAEHLLLKEGEWTEFDNDTSPSFFWKGIYLDNKKAGLWKHVLQMGGVFGDTVVLEQADYSKGSSQVIYSGNGIRNRSLEELQNLLPGNWGNEECVHGGISRYLKESVKWYIYWRGRTLTMNDSYFQFYKSGKFIKTSSIECDSTNKSFSGKWTLRRNGDQTFIDLIFQDGATWQMELLHYSAYEGLIVNLDENPHALNKMKP